MRRLLFGVLMCVLSVSFGCNGWWQDPVEDPSSATDTEVLQFGGTFLCVVNHADSYDHITESVCGAHTQGDLVLGIALVGGDLTNNELFGAMWLYSGGVYDTVSGDELCDGQSWTDDLGDLCSDSDLDGSVAVKLRIYEDTYESGVEDEIWFMDGFLDYSSRVNAEMPVLDVGTLSPQGNYLASSGLLAALVVSGEEFDCVHADSTMTTQFYIDLYDALDTCSLMDGNYDYIGNLP